MNAVLSLTMISSFSRFALLLPSHFLCHNHSRSHRFPMEPNLLLFVSISTFIHFLTFQSSQKGRRKKVVKRKKREKKDNEDKKKGKKRDTNVIITKLNSISAIPLNLPSLLSSPTTCTHTLTRPRCWTVLATVTITTTNNKEEGEERRVPISF
ncbi:hypothetical protein RJT34_14266 [Clitoria ternatea]|uniref:Uncharacterized protein n=1 Tax=Clitoria ternatea TaxID=43366 RepID=A0AAN9PN15_CLITE